MNSEEEKYKDVVGVALYNLPVDGIIEIDQKVKPENRKAFIQIVKDYIDKNFGNNENWQITFNSNYSKVRKEYFFLKQ